jgi:hypothetical protein
MAVSFFKPTVIKWWLTDYFSFLYWIHKSVKNISKTYRYALRWWYRKIWNPNQLKAVYDMFYDAHNYRYLTKFRYGSCNSTESHRRLHEECRWQRSINAHPPEMIRENDHYEQGDIPWRTRRQKTHVPQNHPDDKENTAFLEARASSSSRKNAGLVVTKRYMAAWTLRLRWCVRRMMMNPYAQD